jgi:hypothetical protein
MDPKVIEKLTSMAADLEAAISVIDGSSEAYTPEQICEVLATLAMDCRTLARDEIPDHPATREGR